MQQETWWTENKDVDYYLVQMWIKDLKLFKWFCRFTGSQHISLLNIKDYLVSNIIQMQHTETVLYKPG